MFESGSEVEIVEDGEVIDQVFVVKDNRSEIEVRDASGNTTTFAHSVSWGGWKMLFEGLGGERCFGRNSPVYEIRGVPPVPTPPTSSVADEMGVSNLDDIIGTGWQ